MWVGREWQKHRRLLLTKAAVTVVLLKIAVVAVWEFARVARRCGDGFCLPRDSHISTIGNHIPASRAHPASGREGKAWPYVRLLGRTQ